MKRLSWFILVLFYISIIPIQSSAFTCYYRWNTCADTLDANDIISGGPLVDVRRYLPTGYVTDGSVDYTTQFQAALDNNPTKTILVPAGSWKVTGTLTLKGRTTIRGVGLESEIIFAPSGNNDSLFEAPNCDNIKFEDISVTGSGSATGKRAFNFDSTVSRVYLRNVYVSGFDYRGFVHDSAQHDTIENCRFLNVDYSATATALGRAIEITTYGNHLNIIGCRFANNDQAIYIQGGKGVNVVGNSFEEDGDSGNTFGIANQINFDTCQGVVFSGNYVEAERTAASMGVIRIDSSGSVKIDGNTFHGDISGTTHSDMFVWVDATSRGISVSNNYMSEILTSFIRGGNNTIKAHGNRYYDNSAELTTYNGIMAKMTTPDSIEIDMSYSFTYDAPNLADNTTTTQTEAVTGAVFTDTWTVSAPASLQGIIATAHTSSSGNVTVVLFNRTGGAIDLATGTWRLRKLSGTY